MPPLDNTPGENVIPEAIRRQSQRADELAREAGVANVPAVDPAPTDPPADPPVVAPPAPVATTVVPPAQTDDWEQRYRTLQGKYDSEVPGLRAQIGGLERLLATIDQRTRQPEPTPAEAPPVATTVVVPNEDVEAYGDELITASRRWATAELMPHIQRLEATVQQLQAKVPAVEQSVQVTQTNMKRDRVFKTLDSDPEVGTIWRGINDDPKFWDGWCLQADPFSGHQRLQMLREAFDAGDGARCKAFITAYLKEQTVSQVPASQTPTPPVTGTGAPTLEDLAAPGRASGQSPAGAPNEKRVWSPAQISAFYRDVQKGVYNGREPEKRRLEQDIVDAATEGRVR